MAYRWYEYILPGRIYGEIQSRPWFLRVFYICSAAAILAGLWTGPFGIAVAIVAAAAFSIAYSIAAEIFRLYKKRHPDSEYEQPGFRLKRNLGPSLNREFSWDSKMFLAVAGAAVLGMALGGPFVAAILATTAAGISLAHSYYVKRKQLAAAAEFEAKNRRLPYEVSSSDTPWEARAYFALEADAQLSAAAGGSYGLGALGSLILSITSFFEPYVKSFTTSPYGWWVGYAPSFLIMGLIKLFTGVSAIPSDSSERHEQAWWRESTWDVPLLMRFFAGIMIGIAFGTILFPGLGIVPGIIIACTLTVFSPYIFFVAQSANERVVEQKVAEEAGPAAPGVGAAVPGVEPAAPGVAPAASEAGSEASGIRKIKSFTLKQKLRALVGLLLLFSIPFVFLGIFTFGTGFLLYAMVIPMFIATVMLVSHIGESRHAAKKAAQSEGQIEEDQPFEKFLQKPKTLDIPWYFRILIVLMGISVTSVMFGNFFVASLFMFAYALAQPGLTAVFKYCFPKANHPDFQFHAYQRVVIGLTVGALVGTGLGYLFAGGLIVVALASPIPIIQAGLITFFITGAILGAIFCLMAPYVKTWGLNASEVENRIERVFVGGHFEQGQAPHPNEFKSAAQERKALLDHGLPNSSYTNLEGALADESAAIASARAERRAQAPIGLESKRSSPAPIVLTRGHVVPPGEFANLRRSLSAAPSGAPLAPPRDPAIAALAAQGSSGVFVGLAPGLTAEDAKSVASGGGSAYQSVKSYKSTTSTVSYQDNGLVRMITDNPIARSIGRFLLPTPT